MRAGSPPKDVSPRPFPLAVSYYVFKIELASFLTGKEGGEEEDEKEEEKDTASEEASPESCPVSSVQDHDPRRPIDYSPSSPGHSIAQTEYEPV